ANARPAGAVHHHDHRQRPYPPAPEQRLAGASAALSGRGGVPAVRQLLQSAARGAARELDGARVAGTPGRLEGATPPQRDRWGMVKHASVVRLSRCNGRGRRVARGLPNGPVGQNLLIAMETISDRIGAFLGGVIRGRATGAYLPAAVNGRRSVACCSFAVLS